MVNPSATKAERWILLGIPVLIVAGSLMHFIYDWTGKLTVIGIFAPVNESIWEHLKLTFWPMVLWWFLWYFINGKKFGVALEKWITAAAGAIVASPLVILAFYYTYTGAFGIESLVLDIFSMILGITLGQCLGLHIYKYSSFGRTAVYTAIFIFAIMAVAFTVFTFLPPHIPLFWDSPTGAYGIQYSCENLHSNLSPSKNR
ncbi:MAG: DUF6512 family protein [Bacillota bacterium]|nr:DUF6512 family protein [Bacillota bacterium]